MFDDPQALMRTLAEIQASRIEIDQLLRDTLCLRMAYMARLIHVPEDVEKAAMREFLRAAKDSKVTFETHHYRDFTFSALTRLVWPEDEREQDEWKSKALMHDVSTLKAE